MSKYVAPSLRVEKFTCNACGTYSQQFWGEKCRFYPGHGAHQVIPIERCECVSCLAISFWSAESKTQIYPKATGAPMPHQDLPGTCVSEYMEARNVADESPRAAAALLRLCVQKLLIALGGDGKNIDQDIGRLVAKGLPVQVQQALDVCRVVGNNAVHPGEIVIDEDPDLVGQLFDLINFIVAQTIEREKTLGALVAKLPIGALEAIEKRNAKAISATASPVPPTAP